MISGVQILAVKILSSANRQESTKTYNPNHLIVTSEWFGFTFILSENRRFFGLKVSK